MIKENRKYRSASRTPPPTCIGSTYGTGDGSYSGDENHHPIDISEEHTDMDNIELSGVKKPSSNKNDARPYFNELIQIMRELEETYGPSNFAWNAIWLPKGTRHKELVLSTFPDPMPDYGTGSKWLNIIKGQRRTILWLEVRREKDYTYIVELDCRSTERKGIYILKYKNGNRASNDELRKIMQLWASNNIYCTKYGLKQHGKMSWDRTTIHHKDPQKLLNDIWGSM